ncbi:hypothetical protein J6590_081161 [Homalodisca vitripennis]|nr:hypothetical protein J6590_081161 [Homalodisca vitripennis]
MTVPCLKPLRGADEVSVSADCKSTRLVSVDRDSSLALSRYLIDLRLRIMYVIRISLYYSIIPRKRITRLRKDFHQRIVLRIVGRFKESGTYHRTPLTPTYASAEQAHISSHRHQIGRQVSAFALPAIHVLEQLNEGEENE